MSFISNIDLISGPFPLAVAVLAIVSGAVLLLCRRRRWVVSVTCAAALAALLGWAINWYMVNLAGLSAYDLPLQVIAWLAVGVFAVLLMVLHLVSGRRWRRILAPVAMALVVVAVAMQVNVYYGTNRTIGDMTGASTANIAALPAATAHRQPGQGLAGQAGGPVVDRWVKPARLPLTGNLYSAQIPGPVSGFTGRAGYVYLPPAYQAPNRPLLPVLVLIAGQPGSPADWLKAGELQKMMDTFAAAHQGLAPVVVVPDVNGANSANTMCMDSQIAKTDTFLAVDVPAWIKNNLTVDSNPQHWVVGGFSFGGTCALQMAALHPETYPSAIDLSGEAEPALSANRNTTIQKAFGGNSAAFDEVTPLKVMSKSKYPQSWIYFAAGAQDGRFTGYMNHVAAAAWFAGMTVTTHNVPGAGHSWDVTLNAMDPALTWLAPRLGLAHYHPTTHSKQEGVISVHALRGLAAAPSQRSLRSTVGGWGKAGKDGRTVMNTIIAAILQVTPVVAYLLITALVFAEDALFIGFILPGETAAILGGVLASQQRLDLWLITALVVLAAILGDTVGYEVGRRFGPRLLNLHLLQKRRQKLDDARDFLARRGGRAVFLGRFTAFFRAVMPALAGASHMPYRRFLIFNAAGGLIWGTAAVLLGYFAGNAYLSLAKGIGHTVPFVLLGIAAAGFISWRVHKRRKNRTEHDSHPVPVINRREAVEQNSHV